MPTIVVVKIAHHPHTGMIHFDDGGNAFGCAEPQHRHLGGSRYWIAIERHDPKDVPRKSEASDFTGAGVQYVKQDTLALLNSDRITGPQHFAIDAESLVTDFK